MRWLNRGKTALLALTAAAFTAGCAYGNVIERRDRSAADAVQEFVDERNISCGPQTVRINDTDVDVPAMDQQELLERLNAWDATLYSQVRRESGPVSMDAILYQMEGAQQMRNIVRHHIPRHPKTSGLLERPANKTICTSLGMAIVGYELAAQENQQLLVER